MTTMAARIVAITWATVVAWCPPAFALDPTREISQYAHTAWKVRDGFSKGIIRTITQTPDGYLWLGTDFGLLRFDGVRAVEWQPPGDQPLPSSSIWTVLGTRDGALWIGTDKGLARWKGGTLIQYKELSGRFITALLEDRQGTLWASGTAATDGILCAIREGGMTCAGEDGRFGYGVYGLYEDRNGALWAGTAKGFWRWQPGQPRFFPVPGEQDVTQSFAEDDNDGLLVGAQSGLRRLVSDTLSNPLPQLGQSRIRRVIRDRQGALWVATSDGLVHMSEGRRDVYTVADGLSGSEIYTLFEDREGNIWVLTRDGLDRFRDLAVSTVSMKQGVPGPLVNSVLWSRDGAVWLGTSGGLTRLNNGRLTVYRGPAGARILPNVREIVGSRLPASGVNALFEDSEGRLWIGTVAAFGYLEQERFHQMWNVPARNVRSMVQDAQANLWIADQVLGLLRVSPQGEVTLVPWSTFGHRDFATALMVDRMQGGLLIGFFDGGVVEFRDGSVRARYGATDGLGEGRVSGLYADRHGASWIATEGGLSRVSAGRVVTLTIRNGLPCNTVHWVIEDDAGSMWLNTACGLVRLVRSDVDAWVAESSRSIRTEVFDNADGLRVEALPSGFRPAVAKSADGRLWFVGANGDGVNVLDPGHLPFNNLQPPVHIEQVIADRKPYDVAALVNGRMPLPALTRDLQIDYTALSLVAPEKMRFRYQLEGWDRDWQDAGTRRQAFYTNLPPRTYRFRVIASNNSGVWNDAGAVLDFSVAPAYYQTTWFSFVVVAAFVGVIAGLHQLRLRRVAWQFNMRIEERVNERTRIARELHDTLLQSFQGLLLKFHAITYQIADRPEAKQALEKVIEQASQAMTEGREAVQGLRASTAESNDLARALSVLAEELAHGHPPAKTPVCVVNVEGVTRPLAPLVRDDAYRIAAEALRNAFRHATANRIEVEIRYGQRMFRLRVRDDGKGIDQMVLSEGRREGHYGLAGMRERADLAGGKLTIWSDLDAGTEAELLIPGALAYAKSPADAPVSDTQTT